MNRILITGANGLLGYHLSRVMQPGNDLVISGVEAESPTAALLGLHYHILDISDENSVNGFCAFFHPEVIINAAAYTNVDGCETHQELSYSVNVKGPENLAKWCATHHAILVHYSSDYIFSGESGPYPEDAVPEPLSEYGRQKLVSEKKINALLNDKIIIRTNVLFGKGPIESASFVRWVVDSLRAAKTINIVNDQYNNPAYSNDLAEATRILLENKHFGTYNYGGADYLNRYEFARMIASVFNLNTDTMNPIDTQTLNLKAVRPEKGGLVNDRIRKIPGIVIRGLREILSEMKETGY